jgi:hypothetical protein
MPLTSKRLSGSAQLQRASQNDPPLKSGSSGEGVAILQRALISLGFEMPISTANDTKEADGIFGNETRSALAGFQSKFGLTADGVAGRQTLARLDELFNVNISVPSPCGNCTGLIFPIPQQIVDSPSLELVGDPEGKSARIPRTIRFLTQEEQDKARTIFGNSLDFMRILVTDGLGIDGREFVMVNPLQSLSSLLSSAPPLPPSTKMQIVNLGPAPSNETFFHELTHVWQSQHHITPEAFMVNAIASQSAAALFGGEAYAFIPGKLFAQYGAEQVAQQVQKGKTEIIGHIRAFPANMPDPSNLPSPGLPRWETPGAPGVEM